jgi:hypothetical protein
MQACAPPPINFGSQYVQTQPSEGPSRSFSQPPAPQDSNATLVQGACVCVHVLCGLHV